MIAVEARRLVIWQPLALRDFRLVWLGESISLLGDQFQFVALAWLALQLGGSGLALGGVLTAAGVPRALFMLVGGALSDRVSPRTLMLVSNAARALLVGAMALLVLRGAAQLWQLYALALLFGLVDAIFHPALRTIVPLLVDEERLPAGNALLQGTAQLAALLGPALAGVVVAALGSGVAFAVDAGSFAVATLALWLVRSNRRVDRAREGAANASDPAHGSFLATIVEGVRYALRDPVLRAMLLLIAAVDFAFVGPFTVGVAALADQRFAASAAGFGIMLAAWGGGALLGTVVAGSRRPPRRRGRLTLLIVGPLGLGLALLGVAPTLPLAALLIAAMGLGSGLINVMLIAWLQARSEPALRGRVMGMVMLASQGLAPLSYALAGALVDLHTAIMFAAAGGLIVAATALAALNPKVRAVD